jgi:pimeloyl-ACP methyl ester carboxylesterase
VSAACFIVTRSAADDMAGKARRLKLAQAVMKGGAQAVTGPFEELLFAPKTVRDYPGLVEEVHGWMAGSDPRGLAGGLLAMRERKDYTPFLEGIHLPCLVVGAEEDRAAPAEIARELAASIPGSRLRIVPGAGHMANMERPEIFNEAIVSFLGEICP